MNSLKRSCALLISVAMISACAKKNDKDKPTENKTTTTEKPKPAPETSQQQQPPPPPPPSTQANPQNNPQNQNQSQPVNQNQERQQQQEARRANAGDNSSPELSPKLSPKLADLQQQAPAAPAPAPALTKEQELEKSLPPASPLDTFGGQLLRSYLGGEVTGEQTIAQIFENEDLIMSNLAEMSMAVRTLQEEGKYSPKDQEKVLVLEGAATQFLNEKIKKNEIVTASLEYGTAIALGVVGGIYSGQIVDALKRLGTSSAVQAPWRGIQYLYESAAGSPAAISAWLRSRWAGEAAQEAVSSSTAVAKAQEVADTGAVVVATRGTKGKAGETNGEVATANVAVELPADEAATVSRSSQLYRRTVGYIGSSADAGAREKMVFNHIYRVINSPQLAKGYSVHRIADNKIADVEGLNFVRSGIPGFRISHVPESDHLIARLITRGGAAEYYRVNGIGIRALTAGGEPLEIPAKGTIGLIAARMKQWGANTAALAKSTGAKSRQYVGDSRPYRYATTDPFARRLAQGAAVGIPIAATTLLAIRPLNTKYLTLDDYVRELETDGVKVDKFIDNEREKAAKGRM